jgi:hypothetical protein
MPIKSFISGLAKVLITAVILHLLPEYAISQAFPAKYLQREETVCAAAYSNSAGNSAGDPGRLYATGMTNGTPITFSLPAVTGGTLFHGDYSYTIVVPAGVPQLTVQLTTSTANADVDLYVRFGQDVALSADQTSVVADYKSEGDNTGNENITINAPQAGTYYIAFGVFTTNITISCTITAAYQAPAGGMIVAQFVNGSGWTTALFLTNLASASESYTVKFYGSGGTLRKAPIQGFGQVDTISASLAPGQTVVYQTSATASLEPGWAIVTPALENSKLSGFAVFRFSTFGLQDSEAIVTLGNMADKSLVMLYDQQNSYTTGLALVNPGSTAITLNVSIRDQNGIVIGSDVIALPAYGQQSSFVYQNYPITLNKMGSLLITSNAGFAAVGLRFSPSGPFTSFPPLK